MNLYKRIILSLIGLLLFSGTAHSTECGPGFYKSTLGNGCLLPKPYEDADALEKPMTFVMRQVSIRAETTWIAAEGIITEDTPSVFRAFLKSNTVYRENRIEFNSTGGNLYAAMELGRIIRSLGNHTSLGASLTLDNPDASMDVHYEDGGICLSACVYAFLGGTARYFSASDFLGVHRFGSRNYFIPEEVSQRVASDLAKFIEDMGVDQRLLQIASRFDFEDDIFRIQRDVAETLSVIFDPNNQESSILVELLGENVVGNTKIFHQDGVYDARFHCIDGYPRLVVWGPKDRVPQLYHNLDRGFARLNLGGSEVIASVVGGTTKSGNAYLTFSAPNLIAAVVASENLSLDMIYPPTFEAMQLFDRIRWADAAVWFGFSIRIGNAKESLPIVMRECR